MFARRVAPAGAFSRIATRLESPQCLRQRMIQQPYPSPQAPRIQQRPISTYRVVRERLKILYRGNPVTLPLAIVSLAVSLGFVGYVAYGYQFFIKPIDHNYPEPVATKLKRAIYHTSLEPDLVKALKFYQQALEAAEEAGMNPFSDELIGIKLRIAHVLEENRQLTASIKMLELLQADIQRWIETYGDLKEMRLHRTRLLRKSVQLSVKLGQLYSGEAIDDVEEAEKHLTEGVETTLRETQRRERDKVSDAAEGPWFSNEEIGGTLEELAYHFDKRSQHSLASPLFLRALTLNPPPCHAATLMNNLAASLAQTAPTGDPSQGLPPPSRPALISNAAAWASKALTVTESVSGDARTAECDECAALATLNLGEFAEMEGRRAQARERYVEAAKLAMKVGYAEALTRAEVGLGRVDKEKKGR